MDDTAEQELVPLQRYPNGNDIQTQSPAHSKSKAQVRDIYIYIYIYRYLWTCFQGSGFIACGRGGRYPAVIVGSDEYTMRLHSLQCGVGHLQQHMQPSRS